MLSSNRGTGGASPGECVLMTCPSAARLVSPVLAVSVINFCVCSNWISANESLSSVPPEVGRTCVICRIPAVTVQDPVHSARLGIEPGVADVTPLSVMSHVCWSRNTGIDLCDDGRIERATKYIDVLIC